MLGYNILTHSIIYLKSCGGVPNTTKRGGMFKPTNSFVDPKTFNELVKSVTGGSKKKGNSDALKYVNTTLHTFYGGLAIKNNGKVVGVNTIKKAIKTLI